MEPRTRPALDWARPLVFFILTMLSTLWVGAHLGLEWDHVTVQSLPDGLVARLYVYLVYGAPFCLALMSILLSHEMGHYLTARYYNVDTTLPYFIPFPFLPFTLVGTLGAFIVIRSPFPNRRSLLDVGLAGPFAGFLVALPMLAVGAASSRPLAMVSSEGGITLGDPLIFQYFVSWFGPVVPDGHVLFVGPVALAAWFGLLLTAINLFPIGQLDGGHATYALFRRKAHRISAVAFLLLFPMVYFGPTWLVWALIAYAVGIRRPHPPTLHDDEPLPTSRKWMGVAGLLVFILCFTPEPIEVSWREMFQELARLVQ